MRGLLCRYLMLAATVAVVFSLLVACLPQDAPLDSLALAPIESIAEAMPDAGAEIALLTTEARLASGFGQTVWNTISRFSAEKGTTCGAYKAEENDAAAAVATLELAVRGGATLLFSIDETVTSAVADAAAGYPDIQFVLLDSPLSASPADNATLIRFSALEGGWLAGYTAVYEEDGTLGVVHTEDERSAEFAFGFALGAEYAAIERQMPSASLGIVWAQANAQSQLAPKTEEVLASHARLIFAAVPPAMQPEVLAGVRAAGGKLFGVGLPLAESGVGALATVAYEPKGMVQQALDAWYTASLPKVLPGGAGDGAVQLLVNAERFENARTWILSQASIRFEGGTLSAELARTAESGQGKPLPAIETLELSRVVILQPGDEIAPATASMPSNSESEPPASSMAISLE